MRRDKRDAERAARRAKRLAERAEERARRAERHAQRAAERADRLNSNRRPGDRDRSQSFEDMVDDFAQKAEKWINEQAGEWMDPADEREVRRAERDAARAKEEADRARANADRAHRAADDLDDYRDAVDSEFDDENYASGRRYGRGRRRHRRRNWRKRRRSAHLYRDKERGKFLGVCAGLADYFGRAPWEIRLYTVIGLVFIPSVTIPAYFISYFIMDDKPYYKRVTDRFDESLDSDFDPADDEAAASRRDGVTKGRKARGSEPDMDNVQAMKTAREKFSNIEQRLRDMESHVTSSRFELQREFQKIAGED